MAVKSAKVQKIDTKIVKDMHIDIEERPEHIRNWYSDNIIKRVFSYSVGLGEDGRFHILRLSENGELRSIDTSKVYYHVKYYELCPQMGETSELEFDDVYKRIVILIDDGIYRVYFKNVNDEYEDYGDVSAPVVIDIPIYIKGIKIINQGEEISIIRIRVFK